MVMLKTKSALSYFGSDSEVAESLASMLDHCKHVTIPFVGGASILPHLKARAIVANDVHDLAICFYRAMSSRGELREQLIHRCQHTLSHPTEIAIASEIFAGEWGDRATIGDKAWAMWALCWIGRKGKGGTKHQGGMPSVRRTANGGTNASRIRAAADDLVEWAKQFERCEWESVCFRELLPKVADNPECGVYCDPPWVGVGRNYLHEFSEQDHIDLANCLSRFEASTVVVRYGDHPLIRQYYGEMGWRIIEAESRDQCNVVKGEVWITNQSGD
jgi:site-specific DNA-adenine methylase